VLRVASVLGRRFSVASLAIVLGRRPSELVLWLDGAMGRRRPAGGGGES
jgi:hypothetical protein